MDIESTILAAAEAAIDGEQWTEAARLLDTLSEIQTTPAAAAPQGRRISTVHTAAALECARRCYADMRPADKLKAAAAALRATAEEERRYNRPGYAYATTQAADLLDTQAAAAADLLHRARVVVPVAAGARLPDDWIATTKARHVAEILQGLGMERTGGRWSPCPACQRPPGKDRRGSVLVQPHRWHCVACSAGGSAIDAVGWTLHGRAPAAGDFQPIGHWLSRH